jgi:glycosyltransferase involved in cell wall biosynthesis
VAYRRNAEEVALHFQAADIYLHAAKDDNFPNTVLEALACGTPVVATAVGGIPEQIRGLYQTGINDLQLNTYGADAATGVLVAPGDSSTIAAAVVDLLADPQRLQQLSLNASRDAAVRFDMERQVDIYIDWFHQILEETAADFKKT